MRNKLRMVSMVVLIVCTVCSLCIPAHAASMSDTYNNTVLVGFTDYGWVSFGVDVTYTENYTANTNSNTYTSRNIYYYVTASRSDSPASFTHGNIYHQNGSGTTTSQYSLTNGSAYFPGGGWRYAYKTNSSTVTYPLTSAFTGHFGFRIAGSSCVYPFSTTVDLAFGSGS